MLLFVCVLLSRHAVFLLLAFLKASMFAAPCFVFVSSVPCFVFVYMILGVQQGQGPGVSDAHGNGGATKVGGVDRPIDGECGW